ncbi:MAG: uncharacterized protein PWR13_406 [Archaeoglobi archaeon]|nr:uncharacterized protein [Archaeoglobi archaeon]MDK2781378.1 uncharacterized protein [Archaeoglobi archaeon]
MIEEFGIENGIYEVIVTTKDLFNEYNAAPMGLIADDSGFHFMIYTDTRTFTNIVETEELCVNFVFDPLLYVRSAFTRIPREEFEERDGVVFLRDADAWIWGRAEVSDEGEPRRVEFIPEKSEILRRVVRPVNRGFNSIIEATIHATRLVLSGDERYLEWIRHHFAIVEKCGSSRDKEAMEELKKYIEEFSK